MRAIKASSLFALVVPLALGCTAATPAHINAADSTGSPFSLTVSTPQCWVTICDSENGAGYGKCTDLAQGPMTQSYAFSGARDSVTVGGVTASVDGGGHFSLTLGNQEHVGHLDGQTLSVLVTDDAPGLSSPDEGSTTSTCFLSSGIGVAADGTTDAAMVAAVVRNGGEIVDGTPNDVNDNGAAAHGWAQGMVQDLRDGSFRILMHENDAANAYIVGNDIFNAFYNGGGPGVFGYPTSDLVTMGGPVAIYGIQAFDSGYVRWNGSSYVAVTGAPNPAPGDGWEGGNDGAVAAAYTRNGGAATVGQPLGSESFGFEHYWNGYSVQDFDGGSGGRGWIMHEGTSSTAYWVYGDMWNAYWGTSLGLGAAIEDRHADASQPGKVLQRFDNGYIGWDVTQSKYAAFPGAPSGATAGIDGSGNLDSAIAQCQTAHGWSDPVNGGRGATVFRWDTSNVQSFSLGDGTGNVGWCFHVDGASVAYGQWGGIGDYYVDGGGPDYLGYPTQDTVYANPKVTYPPFKEVDSVPTSYGIYSSGWGLIWWEGTGINDPVSYTTIIADELP